MGKFCDMETGISVIIPAYNSALYLPQAITSVFDQAYTPLQLIIVDDGSTDETAEVLQPYQSQILYLRQENSGSAAARNRGLQHADYPFILFLDADDKMLAGKLRRQAAFLHLHPELGYVSSGWQEIDEAGKLRNLVEPWHVAPELSLDELLSYKPVQLGAILFRRLWLDRVGGLDPSLRQAHDVDLLLRLGLAGCQGGWVYLPTIAYRQHEASTMRRDVSTQAVSILKVLDKFFQHPALPPSFHGRAAETRYFTLLWLAWYAVDNGDRETAVSSLQECWQIAAQSHPFSPQIALVEWIIHFSRWQVEHHHTTTFPDVVWSIFQTAATNETIEWPSLQRLKQWWEQEENAAYRDLLNPYHLWHAYALGMRHEKDEHGLSAERFLRWWGGIWLPLSEKSFTAARAGWMEFKKVTPNQLRALVAVSLTEKAVDTAQLSWLWHEAAAHNPNFAASDQTIPTFTTLPGLRMPRISVIVPVYNGAAHIRETLAAVFAQTYTDFELIVVDDGSTDETAAIVGEFDGLLRLIRQPNQGVSAARNAGLRQALGEFILFLDGDDVIYPEKLALQVQILEEDHLLGAVHSGWRLVDAYGRPLRSIRPWKRSPQLDLIEWLKWKPVFLGAMLFRRNWLERIDGFRTDLRQAEDTDFLLRLSLAGCPMRWLKTVTIDYRQHGAGVTNDGRQQARDLTTVLTDFAQNPQLPSHVQRLLPEVRSYSLIWSVWQLQITGYEVDIPIYLRQAMELSPHEAPEILVQNWLMQLADYSYEAGHELSQLRTFYPHFCAVLEFTAAEWLKVAQILDWWLDNWPLLQRDEPGGAMYNTRQFLYRAIHFERGGHVLSAAEWIDWWLRVWRHFLPQENCGAGHELNRYIGKPAREIVKLAQAAIVYAPEKIQTWQIALFWRRASETGLITAAESHMVTSLYLTYFGQSLLGGETGRALNGLGRALRTGWKPNAWAAWGEFMQAGYRYWRDGRAGSAH
jgi:glycosyltransferase involved in cell wall biosynthesis